MRKREDLTDQEFGRWLVKSESDQRRKLRYWNCVCSCGVRRVVEQGALKRGATTSCGCRKLERITTRNGDTKHPSFDTWRQMISRCTDVNNKAYDNYGGRGISVCDEWMISFNAFTDDMGEKPEGFTLDRRNNDKGYTPDNCRWATAVQQSQNRRNSIMVFYKGFIIPLIEKARIDDASYELTYWRLKRNFVKSSNNIYFEQEVTTQ